MPPHVQPIDEKSALTGMLFTNSLFQLDFGLLENPFVIYGFFLEDFLGFPQAPLLGAFPSLNRFSTEKHFPDKAIEITLSVCDRYS